MKRLSFLQKKLTTGFEELKGFVQEHEALLSQTATHAAEESCWQKSRRRLEAFIRACAELDDHEARTGKGAVELYWQARVNSLHRQRTQVFLEGKEAEFLGKAAIEGGRKLQKMIPPAQLDKLLHTRLSDAEIMRAWSKQAEFNMHLLGLLATAESDSIQTRAKATFWSIAVENALAAVSLVQFEEALFQGKLRDWPVLNDDVLKMGWTMESLARVEGASLQLEEKLAELHRDFETVTRISQQVQASRFIPDKSSESAALVKKCVSITNKYLSSSETRARTNV